MTYPQTHPDPNLHGTSHILVEIMVWGLAQTSPSTFLSPSHPLSLPQAVQEE